MPASSATKTKRKKTKKSGGKKTNKERLVKFARKAAARYRAYKKSNPNGTKKISTFVKEVWDEWKRK